MIEDRTVFILGAGASCPYGYPSGRELREEIYSYFANDIKAYLEARKSRNLTEAKAKLSEKIHRFFLDKMNQYDFLSRGSYIWGNLYMVFGKHFWPWQMKGVLALLALITFFLLALGFIGRADARPVNFLFVIPVFGVLSADMLPYRSMLLPAGRTDKYFSSLVLAIVITLSAGLLVLALTGISVFLETTLPEFSFRGGAILSYYGMDIGDFYIYLLFMPVTLSMAVAFPRTKPWFIIVLVVVFMQGWIISKMVLKQNLIDLIGPVSISGLIALCWIGFLVVLYYVCMKRSLVGQGG